MLRLLLLLEMLRAARIKNAVEYVQTLHKNRIFAPAPPTLLPTPLSQLEAMNYYNGIPSCPVLVARTNTAPWSQEGSTVKKISPVRDHPIKGVWEDNLAFEIHKVLDDLQVNWTSTDVVRIGYRNEDDDPPVILWVGVKPTTLSGYDGLAAASKCRDILFDYGIRDVHVEIRESAVTRWNFPPPFKFPPMSEAADTFAQFRTHLTTTLGLSICAKEAAYVDGTGGFYFTAGDRKDKILLVTARHVLFPLDGSSGNNPYQRTKPSPPKYQVSLMSVEAYVAFHITPLEHTVGSQAIKVQSLEKRLEDNCIGNLERTQLEAELLRARAALDEFCQLWEELDVWDSTHDRVFGHVILSPSITYGANRNDTDDEGYTSDWAVIEIDPGCIDKNNFYGNVIDLRTVPADELSKKLGPDFSYPEGSIFRLNGTISNADMRRGSSEAGAKNLVVVKNGLGSGLTVGRANDVCSYARSTYFPTRWPEFSDTADLQPYASQRSKEWAILSFDSTSGAFAGKGDSGAVVADSTGRIGGIITGGTGTTRINSRPFSVQDPTPFTSDITYVTPISFLLGQIDRAGLKDIDLNPALR